MTFRCIPRYAVLDPKVTLSLPPFITATTGMDALTHAVEAYIGNSTTPGTRKNARDAVQLEFSKIWTLLTPTEAIKKRAGICSAPLISLAALLQNPM